jgi:hypothetical protein
MLTLSEEQVKQLEALISEMPGKFCIPLLNILNEKPNNSDVTTTDIVQPDEEV